MENLLALLFLILFGVSTVLMYLAVRRRWTRVLIPTLVGLVADTVTIMGASLARGTALPEALLSGFMLALMFTGITVSIAMFYRANPPGQPPNPPRKPAITPVSSTARAVPPHQSERPRQAPPPR